MFGRLDYIGLIWIDIQLFQALGIHQLLHAARSSHWTFLKLPQAMATSPGFVSHHAAEKRDSKHHQLQCNDQQLRITVALGIAFVSCHVHSEGVQRCHQLQRNHHLVSRHISTHLDTLLAIYFLIYTIFH